MCASGAADEETFFARRWAVVQALWCLSWGLDCWSWKELEAFPAPWLDGLSSVLRLIESEEN